MVIKILGLLELGGTAGRSRRLVGRAQRRLLAVLAAHAGRPVPAATLVENVWGADPPKWPDAALHNLILRLRRTLSDCDPGGGALIQTHARGYVLNVGEDGLDSLRFEALVGRAADRAPRERVQTLREALGLWRGEAFTGFTELPDVLAEATRLEELRCRAGETLGAGLIEQERSDEAIGVLEHTVRAHPLREQARRLLIEALYKVGRQTDALSQLHAYRRVLADELGLRPSGMLRDLELALLRQEIGHDARGGPPLGEPPGPENYATIGHRLSVAADRLFVGRDEEVRSIAEAVRERSPVAVVYVHGPGGIGKTAVLAAARRRTPRLGWLTVEASGLDPVPERFVGQVADQLGCPATLHALTDEMARRGTGVLAVDEAEHLKTLEPWLRTRFLPALPVGWTTVLCGRLPPDPGWFTTPEWWDLAREIPLVPLDDGAATTYLERAGVGRESIGVVRSLAGGYPVALALFATAALDGRLPGPDGAPPLAESERLAALARERLSAQERRVLDAACVVRHVTLPVLRALLAGEPLDVGRAWDLLRGLPFSEMTETGIRIHAAMRDSVARTLDARDPARAAAYRARVPGHVPSRA
ncbi:BTAD domain-containing putative transcriptional regulator [Sphaerisporangium sp. B11E5]|uniref:BTAD domain-containing putative transcriptional regulator n=1 Tax=Sphaerisporangium sp. B11E5 TaxID=3153563 RepID=UPI00325EE9A7